MPNKIKRTITIAAESDYEIHQLAKLWGVTVTKARERCYHYVATRMKYAGSEAFQIKEASDLRQAEVKVELLKAGK